MLLRKRKPDSKYYGDYNPDDNAPLPEKKKSPLAKLKLLTYGPIALSLFIFSFVFLIVSLLISIGNAGTTGIYIGIFGIVAFMSSFIGMIVALYGHFIVKIEGKIHWLLALLPNVVITGVFVTLYIIGLNN